MNLAKINSLHTDDRQLAVALKYRPGDAAPRIVARGFGLIADEIIARAKEHGVFVHESPELVTLLCQVNIDQHIPAALYTAVAELLAWIYALDSQAGQDRAATITANAQNNPA